MTVQDDKAAGRDDDRQRDDEQQPTDKDQQQPTEKDKDKSTDKDEDQSADNEDRATEKPEPDEDDKKAAAEMMEAYKDKPTIVLPGSAGMVSGTAVNEWLDDDGNPKMEVPDDADEEQKKTAEEARNDDDKNEQIDKDKSLNEKLREAAGAENKGEKD
jgi:hypothetical protein